MGEPNQLPPPGASSLSKPGATTEKVEDIGIATPGQVAPIVKTQDIRSASASLPWKLWILEALAFFISVAGLLIIVSVLAAFDGKELPSLPMDITLNTFLAFFTTIVRVAITGPVAECISQWKWNWFHHERPLADFQIFDRASRGILGSVLLIKLLKWNHFAVVGGIVSILGLATSPITQLMIQYPSRLVRLPAPPPQSSSGPTAAIPAIHHYRSRVGIIGSWSLDIAASISAGLTHPSSAQPISPLAPTCPSANCEWNPLQSLGLCVRVVNITDRLTVRAVNFSTPRDWTAWDAAADAKNPLRLNGTLAYNVSFAPVDGGDVLVAPAAFTVYSAAVNGPPIASSLASDADLVAARVATYKVVWSDAGNVTYAGRNTSAGPAEDPTWWSWQAVEFLYYACVNTYRVGVRDGVPLVDSEPPPPSYAVDVAASSTGAAGVRVNCTAPRLTSGGGSVTTCRQDSRTSNQGVMTLRAGEGQNFTADVRSLTLVAKSIMQDSLGVWAWDGLSTTLGAVNTGVPTLADAVYGFMPDNGDGASSDSQAMAGNQELQMKRLKTAAENIAVSVTNGIRSLSPYQGTANAFLVDGTVLDTRVFVQVRWGWLTVLAVQVLLSLVFFIWTVVMTQKMDVRVLKSSAVAMLFALHDAPGVGQRVENGKSADKNQSRATRTQVPGQTTQTFRFNANRVDEVGGMHISLKY